MQMWTYEAFTPVLLPNHRQLSWEHAWVRQRLVSQRNKISCRSGNQVGYTHGSNSAK